MKNGITKFKYEHVLGFNFAGAKKTFDSEFKHIGETIYKLNGAIEWSPESSNIVFNIGIKDNYIKIYGKRSGYIQKINYAFDFFGKIWIFESNNRIDAIPFYKTFDFEING